MIEKDSSVEEGCICILKWDFEDSFGGIRRAEEVRVVKLKKLCVCVCICGVNILYSVKSTQMLRDGKVKLG